MYTDKEIKNMDDNSFIDMQVELRNEIGNLEKMVDNQKLSIETRHHMLDAVHELENIHTHNAFIRYDK